MSFHTSMEHLKMALAPYLSAYCIFFKLLRCPFALLFPKYYSLSMNTISSLVRKKLNSLAFLLCCYAGIILLLSLHDIYLPLGKREGSRQPPSWPLLHNSTPDVPEGSPFLNILLTPSLAADSRIEMDWLRILEWLWRWWRDGQAELPWTLTSKKQLSLWNLRPFFWSLSELRQQGKWGSKTGYWGTCLEGKEMEIMYWTSEFFPR